MNEEFSIKTTNEEDFVYVVTGVEQDTIPHSQYPMEVYEDEDDALDAISEYREEYIFAYGYKMKLQ